MSKMTRKNLSRRAFIGSSIATAGGILIANKLEAMPSFHHRHMHHKPMVRIYTEGDFRIIETNGVPNHPTGKFPNEWVNLGIGNRVFRYSVPLNPVISQHSPQSLGAWRLGIAVNGVPFDPNGPALVEGWAFEVASFRAAKYLGIDFNNAHVQQYPPTEGQEPTDGQVPTEGQQPVSGQVGQYHYHACPVGLYMSLFQGAYDVGDSRTMFLLGYAADGFPIYASSAPLDPYDLASQEMTMRSSYRLKQGLRKDEDPNAPMGNYDGTFVQDYEYVEGLGDLDECNGRVGVTPEYQQGTYYYVVTQEFPFLPRKFMGTPVDETFKHILPSGSDDELVVGDAPAPPELTEYPH
jgi:hypothetical protein